MPKRASGMATRAAELARWASGGSMPRRARGRRAPSGSAPPARGRSRGRSRPWRGGRRPRRSRAAARAGGAPRRSGPARSSRTPMRPMPVSILRWTRRCSAFGGGRGRRGARLRRRGRRRVDAVAGEEGQALVGGRAEDEDGRGDAGLAERERLLYERDAEVVGALGEELPRHPQHAVPVGVGLDHGHDLDPGAGELAGPREVPPQGAEPDLGARGPARGAPPRSCRSDLRGLRMSWAARSAAFTTALMSVSRRPPASSSRMPSIVVPAGVVTMVLELGGMLARDEDVARGPEDGLRGELEGDVARAGRA